MVDIVGNRYGIDDWNRSWFWAGTVGQDIFKIVPSHHAFANGWRAGNGGSNCGKVAGFLRTSQGRSPRRITTTNISEVRIFPVVLHRYPDQWSTGSNGTWTIHLGTQADLTKIKTLPGGYNWVIGVMNK
jgi:hypothetical protein